MCVLMYLQFSPNESLETNYLASLKHGHLWVLPSITFQRGSLAVLVARTADGVFGTFTMYRLTSGAHGSEGSPQRMHSKIKKNISKHNVKCS